MSPEPRAEPRTAAAQRIDFESRFEADLHYHFAELLSPREYERIRNIAVGALRASTGADAPAPPDAAWTDAMDGGSIAMPLDRAPAPDTGIAPDFPIIKFGPIPRWIAEQAYINYAQRYGTGQSLDRLAERGGFHVAEMDTLYPEWRDRLAIARGGAAPSLSVERPDLDESWKVTEQELQARSYPGTDGDGGWSLQLYGYPSNLPFGPDTDDRYHAMAHPSLDSHHRNTITATGPTPVEALARLRDRLRASTTEPSAREVGE